MVPIVDMRAIRSYIRIGWLFALAWLGGCHSVPSDRSSDASQRTFALRRIDTEQAKDMLSALGFDCARAVSDPDTVVVRGPVSQIEKAATILDVIDTNEPFIAETLSPASAVRALPSNEQIAQAIGSITIGTFANPPQAGQSARAIIDVLGDSVVAIAPARLWPDIHALVALGPQAWRDALPPVQQSQANGNPAPTTEVAGSGNPTPASNQAAAQLSEPDAKPATEPPGHAVPVSQLEDRKTSSEELSIREPDVNPSGPAAPDVLQNPPVAARGILRPSTKVDRPAPMPATRSETTFPNGDAVLELTLPEKIELMQLLDLAGQYLGLDCVYEPEKIGNQVITLKLHSKMRSEMRVKDLYSLLQTILRFKGLVMTRHEGNLVSIVPAAEAMDIDPELVDPNNGAIQAGDVIVTRIFELQHVDVASVTSLLQNMKLSVAVSPIPETQTLFVTCYAHRMARIEQLVDMVDRPGKPKEFRFRQLQYTLASTLTRKILALAGELEGIAISIGATDSGPQAQGKPQPAGQALTARSSANAAVYLDTDERTNRILMIGPCEQLQTVEGLIDALDVPQQDLRMLHLYEIKRTGAQTALDKLKQLGIVDKANVSARTAKPSGPAGPIETSIEEEPDVVLLEATNSLLVNATSQQHAQLRMVLNYIDVAPQDTRALRVYSIKHVDAQDVARKLQQLDHGSGEAASAGPARVSQREPAQASPAVMTTASESPLTDGPQVVVLELTNSLLVNATSSQHARIETIIQYIDMEAPKQVVPYEIYFLENQDPEQLSQVLSKLIQETILNAEGKVEKTIAKTDEQISIIPDKNTFSLIVHASRKNQDWIAGLIEKLDKRRPQVLIDVTLVEITETDAFNYDLNLITSAPNLTQTSGLTGTIVPGAGGVTSGDIQNRLAASGRSQFADFQSNGGELTAFYGDKHINLLLQAMQSKNYGRVLAKPKILVNDNEPGEIKTADTTYVAKRASIPVGTGGAGTDVKLIETSVTYEPYEAGITLDITPHISQGDLLRMEIELTRSDFRETEDTEKPPDQTTSELKTTVFVPDASTIILGGLLRLNQNKGGTKVPILGDIPLVGGLFRTINNRDSQSKLYIFVKAEIIRPAGVLTEMRQLETISERNRKAFEKHEQEFQGYQSWPGIKSQPIDPPKVLEAR